MTPYSNSAIKSGSKFDALLQNVNLSALLSKQNLDNIKTSDIRHGFTIGSLALLIPKGVRSEVIQAGAICPLPNTANWFSGFVNHRGEALPVFYLEALFNPQIADKKNKQWILFLQQQQKTCGLLINNCPAKVGNLRELTAEQVLAIPCLVKPYVERTFYDGSREWLDFSYHPFFLSLKSTF